MSLVSIWKKQKNLQPSWNSQTNLIDILYDSIALLKNSINRLLNILGKVIIVIIIIDNMFDVFFHPIIIPNGHVVVKLWHLKIQELKLDNQILEKKLTNFCPGLYQ